LDIYGSAEAVRESYAQFVRQIKPGGSLLAAEEAAEIMEDFKGGKATFGTGSDCYYAADNIRIEDGWTVFDYRNGDGVHYKGLRLPSPGLHNVRNAVAAISVTLLAGGDSGRIPRALADFKGVKRRFEYIVRTQETVYVDDYAHHPAELEAAI